MSDRFQVVVRGEPGGTPVIELAGEVDSAADADLRAAWDAAAVGAERIVLDFGGTDYINSSGLAIIVGLLARARAERCEVHVVGLSDHYREIFEITRLSDFVTIHADRAAAFA